VTASSVATYLDVIQAGRGTGQSVGGEFENDPVPMFQAVQVLAALHAVSETLNELTQRTGVEATHVIAALAWLAKSRMVNLEDRDGNLRARLTEPTKAALTSS